jgi:hypothetical protein
MKSFDSLIAKRWDFTGNQAAKIANHWPICLKKDVIVDNRSVVFLGDPTFAPAGGANLNATHQACQISSSQLLYLIVYGGECSQGEFPGESIPQLLTCAQDSNKVMKLMQVKLMIPMFHLRFCEKALLRLSSGLYVLQIMLLILKFLVAESRWEKTISCCSNHCLSDIIR